MLHSSVKTRAVMSMVLFHSPMTATVKLLYMVVCPYRQTALRKHKSHLASLQTTEAAEEEEEKKYCSFDAHQLNADFTDGKDQEQTDHSRMVTM